MPSPALPPPPPLSASPGSAADPSELERAEVPGWKRLLAGLGVAACFPFFLTIPGWIALARYRAWRRGEKPEPRFLMVWGAVASAVVVLAILVAALSPDPPTNPTSQTAANIDPTAVPEIGQCGRIDGEAVQWIEGICGPNDTLEAVAVFPRDIHPYSEGTPEQVADEYCPPSTAYFTWNAASVDCWEER